MSHEIRTPMNAILGYSQLMERDMDLTPSQSDDLNIISRSGEHLLSLINDILDMSKIEAGRITLSPEPFDFHKMMDDIEMMFRAQTTRKNLQFELDWIGEIPRHVLADEQKVRQVVINLIGNAVKFTDKGGIAIRVRMRSAGEQAADNFSAGRTVHELSDGEQCRIVIEVEDTGCGIHSKDMEKVFGAFEQAQSAGREKGGTGLGMAISRKYARMMGGDITVVSEPGLGSKFCFELLVEVSMEKRAEQKEALRRVVGLAPGQRKLQILVVDDQDSNRNLLIRMLGRIGFQTCGAVNGKEAIAHFEQWHPDIILMDIMMPEMDGREAAMRIKAMPDGEKTSVIFVSASVMGEARKEAFECGADGFIQKPFKEAELFETLQRVCSIAYIEEEAETGIQEKSGLPDKKSCELSGNIPEDLVCGIREAVEDGDMDQLMKLIEQAEVHDKILAGKLCDLADQYEYDALLESLYESSAI